MRKDSCPRLNDRTCALLFAVVGTLTLIYSSKCTGAWKYFFLNETIAAYLLAIIGVRNPPAIGKIGGVLVWIGSLITGKDTKKRPLI